MERFIDKNLFRSAIALLFFLIGSVCALDSYYLSFDPIDLATLRKYENLSFEERKHITVGILRAYSEKAQAEALILLDELTRNGEISDVRPLWICNCIRFSATTSAIDQIESSQLDARLVKSIPKEAMLFNPAKTSEYEASVDSIAWGLEQVGVPTIWRSFGLDGKGTLVAILDSGTDFGNPNLIGSFWENTSEIPLNNIDDDSNGYIDDWRGYDWTEDDPWPYDERGHGTHVSGIVAGRGIMGMATGMAPACKIMPLKVLNYSGTGEEADVWEAIQYAIENGARVMNLSIGWRYSSSPDRSAWRAAVESACEIGVVMCIAGGNEGGTDGAPNNLRTPGDVPRALTVGATDILDERASFSSLGPVAWGEVAPYFDHPYPPGLIKPDIVAPGDSVPSSTLGGGVEYWDGTSMACPHLAGASAIILQLCPDISHDSVKALIETSAFDLGPTGKDSIYGSGRLDLINLFNRLDNIGWLRGNTEPLAQICSTPSQAKIQADSLGHFFIAMKEGTYTITADKFGFSSTTSLVSVVAGDTSFINLPISPGIPNNLQFVVRDFDNGAPIGDAILTFPLWPLDSFYTLSDGRIAISISESDTTTVQINKSGWTTYEFTANEIYPDTMLHTIYLQRALDFELDSGLTHWGISDSIYSDDWEWGTPSTGPSPRSGDRLWATRLDTTYSNSSDSWLSLGQVDLSSDAEAPRLEFFQWFELEASSRACWDGGNIKARIPDSEWNIIEPQGGYPIFIDDYNPITGGQPGFSGEFSGAHWHRVVFSLDAFIGDTVELAAHMGSDNNTVYSGWFIDDVAILPKTLREPIFRSVSTEFTAGEVVISGTLFAVNSEIVEDSLLAHFGGAASGTASMISIGEYFECSIEGPFSSESLFIWLSVVDSEARKAIYPHSAPDSMITVLIDFSEDTTSPIIERWAYWPNRIIGLDSTVFVFIIEDSSPTTSIFTFEQDSIIDSIIIPGSFYDTLLITIPLTSSSALEWHITSRDSFGNIASDSSTVTFATEVSLDFHTTSSPFEISDSTNWRWLPDSGWLFSSEGPILEFLDLPLLECPGTLAIEIIGEYHFDGNSAGALIFKGFPGDSFASLPDTIPSGNPFFPGLPGVIGTGNIVSTILPSVSGGIFTFQLAAAIPDSDFAYWLIDSICFLTESKITQALTPKDLSISVFPNPFNDACKICIDNLDKPSVIDIFDICGRRVYSRNLTSETSSFVWDGCSTTRKCLPSGVYLIKLADSIEIAKITLLH
ncbi:S8 family serine peptidase [bacterium]|nr:S8 family serine peptidase [bacterium]